MYLKVRSSSRVSQHERIARYVIIPLRSIEAHAMFQPSLPAASPPANFFSCAQFFYGIEEVGSLNRFEYAILRSIYRLAKLTSFNELRSSKTMFSG